MASSAPPRIGVPEGMHSDSLDISPDRTQVRFPSGEATQALLSTRLPPTMVTTMAVSLKGFDPAHVDVGIGLVPCGSRDWSDPFFGFGVRSFDQGFGVPEEEETSAAANEGGDSWRDVVQRIFSQERFLLGADLPRRRLLMRGVGEGEHLVCERRLPALSPGDEEDIALQRVVFGIRLVGTGCKEASLSVHLSRQPPRPRGDPLSCAVRPQKPCWWMPCLLNWAAVRRQRSRLEDRQPLRPEPGEPQEEQPLGANLAGQQTTRV